jgi:perosamine synthetase
MDSKKLRQFCEEECTFTDGMLTYKNAPVKAIVVVHVFGNMADMEGIMETAKKYQITVVEDATEALGTRYTEGKYAGKYAGTIGNFGCFSFNVNKIITTGGGGAITANSSNTVNHLRYLSTQAKNDPHYYIHDEIGYNYRMTNLQAALGVAQMEELPEFIRRKQRNYELYKRLFDGYDLAELMPFRDGTDSNKWFYSLKINRDRVIVTMREIITSLQNDGIETRAIWGLINEQVPYQNEATYKLEKAPYYADRILNIPTSTNLMEDDIRYVAEKVKELLNRLAK